MTENRPGEPSPANGARLSISPITVAVVLALLTVVVVLTAWGDPRVLTAAGAGWVVSLITYRAGRRG